MNSFQKNPLKLYIQDIFRAQRSEENKYVYEIFDLSFKNIMIQGVVTTVSNSNVYSTNFELSDPTGTVNIYYDSTKGNHNVSANTMGGLLRYYANNVSGVNDTTSGFLLNLISEQKRNPIPFGEGSYVCVVGDIFLDSIRNVRMVSAYQCKLSSLERDILWLEELRYLYEKFYLWCKES